MLGRAGLGQREELAVARGVTSPVRRFLAKRAGLSESACDRATRRSSRKPAAERRARSAEGRAASSASMLSGAVMRAKHGVNSQAMRSKRSPAGPARFGRAGGAADRVRHG